MTSVSPRPWTLQEVAGALAEGFHYILIRDANGDKVASITHHASVGGRGPEQAKTDARFILAIINSPIGAKVAAEIESRG